MEPISRRRFLAGLVASAAVGTACSGDDSSTTSSPSTPGKPGGGTDTTRSTTTAPVPDLPPGLFSLGVASGDPLPDSVILWTRLAPEPLTGGGMPDADVPVRWEVATDAGFGAVVAGGVTTATKALGHSVHVDADGLEAGAAYFYRFVVGQERSPVGRTRTAPAAGADSDRLRFLFASCQNWKDGYFTSWSHAVEEDVDLVVFLGDYIYESGKDGGGGARDHNSDEVVTIDDYRNRYGLYKGDADLQAAHAAAPWVTTWDDHEVENNYAAGIAQDPGDGIDFVARRAAGYQAYYEHQPIRVEPPDGDSLDLYRILDWGGLARFYVLDGRQYRSDQPCPGGDIVGDCPGRNVETATMLGREQEDWLGTSFASSKATWNVLANQVIFTPLPLGGSLYNMDQWDGYPAARTRLLEQMTAAELANPVVITGDVHASGVGDVSTGVAGAPVVATEFVGTSISSEFTPELIDAAEALIGGLPQVKWFDARQRGYVVCELTPDTFTTTYRAVSSIAEPEADISTLTTWLVKAGTPGAREA